MNFELLEKIETKFYCDCSKEKVSKAVISLGRQELMAMIEDNEPIEVNCHFCNSHYQFDVAQLQVMLEQATKRRNLKME